MPAYGALNSSIAAAEGQDNLRISARARGNNTGTFASYGAVDSQLDTGSGNDRVDIRAAANNRRGYTAIGLDFSSIDTGSGDDYVDLNGDAQNRQIQTGDGLDTFTISGRHTNQVHIYPGANDDVHKVDAAQASPMSPVTAPTNCS